MPVLAVSSAEKVDCSVAWHGEISPNSGTFSSRNRDILDRKQGNRRPLSGFGLSVSGIALQFAGIGLLFAEKARSRCGMKMLFAETNEPFRGAAVSAFGMGLLI